MSSKLLYPDPNGVSRVANRVISTLSRLSFVRRMAVFGSIAEDRADSWSDVDLHVACDDAESSKWSAAAAIHSGLPVLYFRRFTEVDPPSGRYWFADESLFHRLDVSFVSNEDYKASLENPEGFGRDITLVEVYSSDCPGSADNAALHARFPEPATEYETEIGSYIYFSIRAIKHHLRGENVLDKDLERIARLRELMPSLLRDAVMNGGRIGELAGQVCEMLDDLGIGR